MALTITALVFIGLECFWRSRGHTTTVADSSDLWSYWRGRASGPETIVLLGASRLQLGFSTRVFRERYPRKRICQLAVDGSSARPALHDLANDGEFRGVVLHSFTAMSLASNQRPACQDHVDHYHHVWGLNRALNLRATMEAQACLVFLRNDLSMLQVFKGLAGGRGTPEPSYVSMERDRSRTADYSRLDTGAHRTERIRRRREASAQGPALSESAWLARAATLEALASRIQDRGGRVVFVRFPTSDEHWEMDQAEYPRQRYWDVFSAQSKATTIHFEDFESLRGFSLADTSHLDATDTPAFTHALLDELEACGALYAPEGSGGGR